MLCLFVLGIGLVGCETDVPVANDPELRKTLPYYVQQRTAYPYSDQLIACAAGGRKFAQNDNFERPVSIFYLPKEGAIDIRYWETDSIGVHPDSLKYYKEKSLEQLPVFGGFLGRFTRPNPGKEIWCRISYLTADSLHVSNAIRIKLPEEPTLVAPGLVNITEVNAGAPIFSWEEDPSAENVIYFQVISDRFGKLLTGTYTFDRNWQFYNLNNVVINVNDIYSNPQLVPGENYTFTLMGVSIDNWVHTLSSRKFQVSAE